MTPELLQKLDDWCAVQRPIPNRPEAIRRLVEEALTASSKRS